MTFKVQVSVALNKEGDARMASGPYRGRTLQPGFTASRIIELPFVPYVGLTLGTKCEQEDGEAYVVESVVWEIDKARWDCWAKDRFERWGTALAMRQHAERLAVEGWTIDNALMFDAEW